MVRSTENGRVVAIRLRDFYRIEPNQIIRGSGTDSCGTTLERGNAGNKGGSSFRLVPWALAALSDASLGSIGFLRACRINIADSGLGMGPECVSKLCKMSSSQH